MTGKEIGVKRSKLVKPLKPLTNHQLKRIDDLLESGEYDLVSKVERILQNYKGHGYDITEVKKEYPQYLQKKHLKDYGGKT